MNTKRLAVATAAALLLVGGGTAAYAYWTTGGTGSGTATNGTTAGVTVNQTTVVSNMYPGMAPVTLSGTFDNPNAGPVYISAVTAAVTGVSGGGTDATKPACTTADFALAGSAPVNAQVPSGTGQGAWSGLTVQMVNNPSANQDNCKGASAVITYTAS